MVLIPQEQAEVLKTICFFKTDKILGIGVVDHQNPELIHLIAELKRKTRLKVKLYLISEHSFNEAFKLYEGIPKIRKIIKGVGITEEELEALKPKIKTFYDLAQQIKNVSVTDIITLIIAAALQSRATDIHVEAEEKDIKIRFRIDGILHTVATLDQILWPKIISRIKLLSSLKINIEDKPQDGSFVIFLTQKKIDVRVSTLPTSYGESVAMRLLLPSSALEFEELGLRGKAFEQFRKEIFRPNGLIVTTGPTGSGKTTTLHAILKRLNKPEIKIATLEDPIEYRLEGVNQSQIDPSKDYTFAKGLKSIMRQDPDIIMVGEIRDLETAEIALNAALTGHLVFSTLHTNDASGAIPRFLALGAKPFLLAPALRAVMAQRLVRKLCQSCKEEVILDKETADKVRNSLSGLTRIATRINTERQLRFYQSKGCEVCQGLGYKGQIGIFEIMLITSEIEKMILSGKVSEYDMKKAALRAGMITMVQDGLLKALDGITSVEEIFRVAE
jgi:type II secretory ATPase GspE/PulE/Tfp pilus assembly ATPase PilB-like protein